MSHTRYSDVLAQLTGRQYRWGYDFLPHDGRHKNPQTGESAEQLMRKLERNPRIVPDVGLEAGIKATRQAFSRLWIAENAGANRKVLDALKRYRRVFSATTNEPGAPLQDESSHSADMVRYAVVSADQMQAQDISDPYAGFRNAASF